MCTLEYHVLLETEKDFVALRHKAAIICLNKNSAIKQLVFTTECLYFAASTTKIRTRNVSRFVEFERHAEHHARQAAAATNADVIRKFF